MKKIIANILKFKRTYILSTVISAIFGVAVFMLFYFLRGQALVAAIDGCTISAVVLAGVGLLCLVARLGAFDTMSYGFRQMFSSLFAKEANKYNDMVDYKEQKNIARSSSSYYFVPMFVVAFIFVIVLIALEIYKSTLL